MKWEKVKGRVSRGSEMRGEEEDAAEREITLGEAPWLMNKMLSLKLPA